NPAIDVLKFLKSFYLHYRFFYGLSAIAFLFVLSFWWNALYAPAWIIVFFYVLLLLGDIVVLYNNPLFEAYRYLPEKFSNGDENPVKLSLRNGYDFLIFVEIIDEIPVQFQKRDFLKKMSIPAHKKTKYTYNLFPVMRGEYAFGSLNCYVSTPLKLVKRRYHFQKEQTVKVYPSFVQMKKYEFLAIDNKLTAF